MQRVLEIDEEAPVDARIAQIRAECDLRMSKCMFIYMICTVALVALLLLPTLRGPALVLFLGGSAGQAYAVWRM
ncbi:MAG: hypothetical protein ACREA0_18075 [bacterium]